MNKHSLGQPYWNAHQVYTWVYTRNPRLAVLLSDRDEGDFFDDPTTIDFHAMVFRPGAEFADYAEAQETIVSTLQEGRLRSWGRRDGVGTLEEIPAVEWVDLHFVWSVFHGFVEAVGMTDDPPASIVGAPRWHGLRFKRDEVLELWPPTETEVETAAEDPTARTQREQDELGPQTDAEIDVTHDGAREAEHDALDDAGDGIDRSRIRPTEFTPEEQSKGGSKPKIHFGLLEYLERLCDSGLAADFRKRSDITLGEIEQILTAFAKGGPVEDRVDIIINDFDHARYDEIAKTLYWEDWMQEKNDKPRKRQQALKSLQPYLDIINRKKPRPEKQDTDLT